VKEPGRENGRDEPKSISAKLGRARRFRVVIAVLKKFDPDHVLPMHCSGHDFIDLAKQEMPEKLLLCTTGNRYTFTA
jgi:metal-dependent hydrolase (beta-lactamase superfamily II)